jgi:hypothetical protein
VGNSFRPNPFNTIASRKNVYWRRRRAPTLGKDGLLEIDRPLAQAIEQDLLLPVMVNVGSLVGAV